jgi:integrase
VNQIASMRADWIDYNNKIIKFPAEVMKSGREHLVPFGPLTEFHLRAAQPSGDYLFSPPGRVGIPFSTWGKPKYRLDESCTIDAWTLHDLRRTWATLSAQLGTEPHIIERVLAHAAGGSIGKIAAIYNRFKYLEQMRDAIIRYENHVVQLCSPM